MGVSDDAPYVDSVYKLVEYDGRPVMKLSTDKTSLPGPKQVWRHSPITSDVLSVRDELGPVDTDPLLVPVIRSGRRVNPPGTIELARGRLNRDLEGLPEAARKLIEPLPPNVVLSERLAKLLDETRGHLGGHHEPPGQPS
jgi:nicotinate phosphoribosyltransferase